MNNVKNKKCTAIMFIIIIFSVLIAYIIIKKISAITSTVCFVRGIVGIPCPSCGMTRAIKAFVSGNIVESFKYHPLFLLPFIFIVLVIINRKYFKKLLIISVSLLIVVYVIRMVMFFPHIEPMKYNENCIINLLISDKYK